LKARKHHYQAENAPGTAIGMHDTEQIAILGLLFYQFSALLEHR